MLKKHAKTTLASLGMLFLLAVGIISLVLLIKFSNNAFDFTSTNLDDKYGKLDTNTKLVLEKNLEEAASENNVEFFFSFVHEDLNDNYIKQLSSNEKAVFIYYNDVTKELNVISNILEKNNDFKKILTSKDDLANVIPSYVNVICNNIKEASDLIYIHNYSTILLLLFVSFFVSFIILANFLNYYFTCLSIYLTELKSYKANKKAIKAAKKTKNKSCKTNKENNDSTDEYELQEINLDD